MGTVKDIVGVLLNVLNEGMTDRPGGVKKGVKEDKGGVHRLNEDGGVVKENGGVRNEDGFPKNASSAAEAKVVEGFEVDEEEEEEIEEDGNEDESVGVAEVEPNPPYGCGNIESDEFRLISGVVMPATPSEYPVLPLELMPPLPE